MSGFVFTGPVKVDSEFNVFNELTISTTGAISANDSVTIVGEGKGVIFPSQSEFAPSAKIENDIGGTIYPYSLKLFNNVQEQTVYQVYAQQANADDPFSQNTTLTFNVPVRFSDDTDFNTVNASQMYIGDLSASSLTATNYVTTEYTNASVYDTTYDIPGNKSHIRLDALTETTLVTLPPVSACQFTTLFISVVLSLNQIILKPAAGSSLYWTDVVTKTEYSGSVSNDQWPYLKTGLYILTLFNNEWFLNGAAMYDDHF